VLNARVHFMRHIAETRTLRNIPHGESDSLGLFCLEPESTSRVFGARFTDLTIEFRNNGFCGVDRNTPPGRGFRSPPRICEACRQAGRTPSLVGFSEFNTVSWGCISSLTHYTHTHTHIYVYNLYTHANENRTPDLFPSVAARRHAENVFPVSRIFVFR